MYVRILLAQGGEPDFSSLGTSLIVSSIIVAIGGMVSAWILTHRKDK